MNKLFYELVIPPIFILLWSSGYIFVEKGLQDNGPLIFLALRFLLAGFVVWLIYLFQRPPVLKSRTQILYPLMAGFFLQVGYLGFFFVALDQQMSAGILAIILGVQPILMALLLRESLIFVQKIGLCLGLFGLALTVSDSIFSGCVTYLGVLSALLALVGITIGTLVQKKYCADIPLCTNMMLQYFSTAIIFCLLSIVTGLEPIKWTMSFMISLLWVSLVMSVIAFFLFYALLKKGKATHVTSLLYCVPPTTALMDYFAFNHVLSSVSLLGMIVVIFSLILIHGKGVSLLTGLTKNARSLR